MVGELEDLGCGEAKSLITSGVASVVRWTHGGLLPPIAVVLRAEYQLSVCTDNGAIKGECCG